jgi:hypothetical protein
MLSSARETETHRGHAPLGRIEALGPRVLLKSGWSARDLRRERPVAQRLRDHRERAAAQAKQHRSRVNHGLPFDLSRAAR